MKVMNEDIRRVEVDALITVDYRDNQSRQEEDNHGPCILRLYQAAALPYPFSTFYTHSIYVRDLCLHTPSLNIKKVYSSQNITDCEGVCKWTMTFKPMILASNKSLFRPRTP